MNRRPFSFHQPSWPFPVIQAQSSLLGILLFLNLFQAVGAELPSANGLLLVCNKGDQTLSIVDPDKNVQIAVIREDGVTGHEVAASLDGRRAFVPIYGNSGVGKPGTDGRILRVIDVAQREIAGTVDFGHGVRPHCAVSDPKTGMLYVTTELENSIAVIDPAALKIVGTVPTGQAESHMLAITRDGRRGYTANVGPGTVSVLDLENKKLLKVIPISGNTQRIALSPDDRFVFTADQTKPRLAVIDTRTDEVTHWVSLPSAGYGTAPTPDGRWLIVAMPGSNEVGMVDLQTMKLARTLPVPRSPQEVLIRPDGAVAYISCDASKEVAAIRLPEWKVDALIKTGSGTDGLAWAKRQ
jgi:DNA-binding beta-propeller fold protein YncE